MLTTWPLYLLVGAFPAALLGIFGHEYASATDVVVVLCAAMLVATASGQVDTVLMMAGKSTWNLAKAVLALVVQLGLDLLLLPHLGILGAAIGWAVSILVANLVPLGQLFIAFGLHPVGRSSVLAVVICTVAVVPVAAVARAVGGDHLVPALIATAVAVLLWAIGLWWFRDPLDARRVLRQSPPQARRSSAGPSGGPGPNGCPGPNGSPGPAGGRGSTGGGSPGPRDRCWPHRRPASTAAPAPDATGAIRPVRPRPAPRRADPAQVARVPVAEDRRPADHADQPAGPRVEPVRQASSRRSCSGPDRNRIGLPATLWSRGSSTLDSPTNARSASDTSRPRNRTIAGQLGPRRATKSS